MNMKSYLLGIFTLLSCSAWAASFQTSWVTMNTGYYSGYYDARYDYGFSGSGTAAIGFEMGRRFKSGLSVAPYGTYWSPGWEYGLKARYHLTPKAGLSVGFLAAATYLHQITATAAVHGTRLAALAGYHFAVTKNFQAGADLEVDSGGEMGALASMRYTY
jgi:hypothetical protein